MHRSISYALLLALPALFQALTSLAAPGAYEPAKVALIQYSSDTTFGDKVASRSGLTELARSAVKNGAKIIIFPEGSSSGYEEFPTKPPSANDRMRTWCHPAKKDSVERSNKDLRCVDPKNFAESVPEGESTRYWIEFAKKNGVYLVFDALELVTPGSSPAYARTAVIVGPNGYLGKHRKGRRFREEEYLDAVAGGPTVLETPYGKFGVAICIEIYDDALFAEYRRQGVSAILYPTHWIPRTAPFTDESSIVPFALNAKVAKVDMLVADDSFSSRSGYYLADGTVVNHVNSPGRNKVLMVDISY